jgi:hypothetical protein
VNIKNGEKTFNVQLTDEYNLVAATKGLDGEFYYLEVNNEGKSSTNVRLWPVLFRASTTDGSIISKIEISDLKGKLFEDDNSYGATYTPVGYPIIRYSATQDKLGLIVTREQVSPTVTPDYFSSIFTMFDGDLSEQHSSLYGTTRFSTKAKETSWGKGISNMFM